MPRPKPSWDFPPLKAPMTSPRRSCGTGESSSPESWLLYWWWKCTCFVAMGLKAIPHSASLKCRAGVSVERFPEFSLFINITGFRSICSGKVRGKGNIIFGGVVVTQMEKPYSENKLVVPLNWLTVIFIPGVCRTQWWDIRTEITVHCTNLTWITILVYTSRCTHSSIYFFLGM